jgi:predicted amidohydrolase
VNDPNSNFGGRGFVYSPTGELLAETSPSTPLVSIDIDVTRVAEAQSGYPCYVREILPSASRELG